MSKILKCAGFLAGYGAVCEILRSPEYFAQLNDVLLLDGCTQAIPNFISAAESALAEIAAPVPVGSAPELSRKRTGPRLSCPACGTYLHGLNAPGSNSPIR